MAMVDKPTPDELKRRREESRKRAIATFPYARIETAGDQALATWGSVGASGRGAPVVVGDDEAFVRLAEMATGWPGVVRSTPERILEVAGRLRHPDSLISQISDDMPTDPETGEWPSIAPGSPQLSVATDLRSGKPLGKVHLIILPTDDWTTIPAYLHWGGWNDCPAPESHVAALRSWRERFGAELVGLGPDVMNIKVARRPQSRAAALDLAREQFVYCSDIVEQGVGTLSALAAALMENDWWYFWWD